MPLLPSHSTLAALLLLAATLPASDAHRFLCCDYNGDKVCVVAEDGTIEWEYPAKHPQDCWLLPNGNYLFAHVAGAIEITPAKQIVWEYQAPEKVEVDACQPLPNGNVLELDAKEQIVWELLENDVSPPLRLMAGCQRLPNGNTIFCDYLGHGHLGEQPQVFEITPEKKIVWQFEDHAHFKTINQIQ